MLQRNPEMQAPLYRFAASKLNFIPSACKYRLTPFWPETALQPKAERHVAAAASPPPVTCRSSCRGCDGFSSAQSVTPYPEGAFQ